MMFSAHTLINYSLRLQRYSHARHPSTQDASDMLNMNACRKCWGLQDKKCTYRANAGALICVTKLDGFRHIQRDIVELWLCLKEIMRGTREFYKNNARIRSSVGPMKRFPKARGTQPISQSIRMWKNPAFHMNVGFLRFFLRSTETSDFYLFGTLGLDDIITLPL